LRSIVVIALTAVQQRTFLEATRQRSRRWAKSRATHDRKYGLEYFSTRHGDIFRSGLSVRKVNPTTGLIV
jgi:hypothetical protein